MIFDELKHFDIAFDSPETPLASPPVFSGGDAVSGRVVVQLSAASDVQSLKLQAKGVAKVQFTDWYLPADEMGDYVREYSDEEEYLIRRELVLLRADNGKPSTLPAGRHEFPFSFQLPEEILATSFQGKHGSIRYWVKVKLQRPSDSVTEIKKEFTFIEPIDVNAPSLLASQAVTKENKNVTVWLRNIGQLSITAGIPRKGYTPGEVIPMYAEFTNTTSRSVTPKAHITQTQTFVDTSEGTAKTESSVVATVCGTKAPAQCLVTWVGHPIRIPMVEPSILHCAIIKVEYTLSVFVEIRGTSKLCVELPLVMGTIPLCRPTATHFSPILHLSFPERPEPPPEYSSVVTEEEAEQYTSASPPAYSEVDPYPQPLP